MQSPKPLKPGDPGFVPRYPPLDLSKFERRIAEREAYADGRDVPAVVADTDMMKEMLVTIRNQRTALACLKTVIDSMQLFRGRK
jgi:hypothetical protein